MYSILYSITTQENGVWQVYCGLLSSNNMIIFYEHGYRISLTLYRSVGGELTKVARNGIDDDRCIDALCNILCRYIIRLCSYSPVILWYHVILPWYHVILTSIPCDTTSFDSLGSWHGPWYQAPSSFTCLQDIILPLRNMQAAKTAGNGDPCYVRPKIPAVSFTAVKQLKKWTSVLCFPLWVDSIGGFHKWRYPNSWMVYSL